MVEVFPAERRADLLLLKRVCVSGRAEVSFKDLIHPLKKRRELQHKSARTLLMMNPVSVLFFLTVVGYKNLSNQIRKLKKSLWVFDCLSVCCWRL